MNDCTVWNPADHPTDAECDAFRRRAMDAVRLVGFADHLAGCEACRARVASPSELAQRQSAFEQALDPIAGHVPEDEVHAYVNGELPRARAEAIDEHMRRCPACAAEIEDLRAFALEERKATPARRAVYAALATAAVIVLAVGGVLLRRGDAGNQPLALSDAGGVVSLDADGALQGPAALTAVDEAAVRNALAGSTLPISTDVADLVGAIPALMGAADAIPFDVLAPRGTAVLDVRPVLQWRDAPAAAHYVVTVLDENVGTAFSSPAVTATSWPVDRPLVPGHTYRWQVAASIDGRDVVAPGPAAADARFLVLGRTAADRLRTLPPSHTVRAVLYARAGLLDEAEREVAVLASMNPDAPLPVSWLRQLRDVRRPRP